LCDFGCLLCSESGDRTHMKPIILSTAYKAEGIFHYF
jgi:putative Ca2+/H+ antiporter (TMEM165/GDT1 family)